MKVALVTDIHFGVRNGSKYFLDKYEKFFSEVFFPVIEERRIDTLLILGDTWEYRTKLDIVAMVRTFRMFFDRLEQLGVKVYIIYGNHDVAYKNTNEYNSVDFLGKMYSNLVVLPNCTTVEFDGTPISFVPWVNNANLEESLEFIKSCPPTVLCGHFEIKSFEMIKGHVCEHGFSKDLFSRFDQVFSGHFHTVSSDGKIFYISNPFQTNWSDFGLDKGFRIFDTQSRDLEFIANPFEVYEKFVYNDDIDILEFDYGQAKDKIVRVYIQSYSGINQNKLNLFVEKMNQAAYSCEVIEVDETQYIDEHGNIEFVDNNQLIETYLNDVIQNPGIDKGVLKGLFYEIYSEAMTMVETE